MGFEPTPPQRLVPKTSALDHSATLPWLLPREMLAVDLERVTLNLRMGFVLSLWKCLFSSVVEHQSRKLGVVGSNPTGGNNYFAFLLPE